MKKIIAIFLGIIISLGALTGCGSSNGDDSSKADSKESKKAEEGVLDPENPIELNFYSYSLTYPTMKAGMEHLIKSFNDTVGKEKGVIVKGIPDEAYSVFRSDIAAGEQVDIIQHTFPTLDNSKINLGLEAYEDIFPEDELKEHFSHMYPNALELGAIDGKTYGLAFTFSTPVLYINGKLFEEAGLDPTKPPKTWEEVKKYAMQIKDKTGKDGFGLGPDNSWTSYGIMYSNGGEVLSEDRKKALFAEDKSVEAYEMWQDFYNSGSYAVGNESEVSEQFMAGNLGMHLHTTALLSGYRDASENGNWELCGGEMPGFGDTPSVPVNSGSALAVRSDSANKSAAIWEFIKYATGQEGYTIITEEIGYLPLRTDVADDPKYLKEFVDNNPIIRINLDQLSRIKPTPIWPGEVAQECSTIFNDETVKAITTESDVKDVLTEAEKQINSLIEGSSGGSDE